MIALLSVALAAEPGGIGAKLDADVLDGFPAVILALPGSPAERADLRPGDLLVAVDGWSTAHEPLDTVVAHIGGAAGTPVSLSLRRDARSLELQIVREPTAPFAEAQQKREAELCPVLWEAYAHRVENFASLRGAAIDKGVFAATASLPTAKDTQITKGITNRWIARFAAPATLDEVVARFAPCFSGAWMLRETDEGGAPVVRFGLEHPLGWYGSFGAVWVASDGSVALSLQGGGPDRLYQAVNTTAPPNGSWVEPLRAVVGAATSDFTTLRGAAHQEGLPFGRSTTWYEPTVTLPERSCRIEQTGHGWSYACALLENGSPADVAAVYDEGVRDVATALGGDWVYWYDDAAAAYDKPVAHFAERTTRGAETVGVVSVVPSETGVTLKVTDESLP